MILCPYDIHTGFYVHKKRSNCTPLSELSVPRQKFQLR